MRYLHKRKDTLSITTISIKNKSDTDGFNEIARGHNENVLAVLELVKLGE
jgi:hypothetical protein